MQTNNPLQENTNEHFPKEKMGIANKYVKRCSVSIGSKETQVKISRRYHFIPPRLTRLQKADKLRDMCRGTEGPVNFHAPLEGNTICYHFGKQVGSSAQ